VHEFRDYLCWSRDFVHWSAPVLVPVRLSAQAKVIQDRRGRFLASGYRDASPVVVASRDLYRWEELGPAPPGRPFLLQRDDGRYEVFSIRRTRAVSNELDVCVKAVVALERHTSDDAATWPKPEKVAEFVDTEEASAALAVHADGRTVLAVFRAEERSVTGFWLDAFREKAEGAWEPSPRLESVGSRRGCIAHHPRWGFVLAWMDFNPSAVVETSGPFLVRGPNLGPWFDWRPPPPLVERRALEWLGWAEAVQRYGKPQDAAREYEQIVQRFPETACANTARERAEALKGQPVATDTNRRMKYEAWTHSRGDVLLSKTYKCTSYLGQKVSRVRTTVATYRGGAVVRLQTHLTGHFESGPYREHVKFMVMEDGIDRYLAETKSRWGPHPESPGEPCGLDSPETVPDAELEKYAYAIYKTYDKQGRITWMLGFDGAHLDQKGAKMAYGENPDYKPDPRVLTWKTYCRKQKTDEQGAPDAATRREVRFFTGSVRVFEVVQEMDYAAAPRPKIRHHAITHLFLDPDNRLVRRGPAECRAYKIEVEDVQTGDPAFQGEWIKSITPVDLPP
jgi:hypothetical protein